MNMALVTGDEVDLEEVADFQRRCFVDVAGAGQLGDVQTADYYRWKYAPPAGEARIAQVREGGALVAMNAMFPMTLSCANTRIRGWQSCDTATAPSARGRGYFLKCLSALKESLSPGEIFFGFPNVNSAPGFRKFGWRTIGVLRVFVGLPAIIPGDDRLKPIATFDESYDSLAARVNASAYVKVHRNAAYLNHRYTSKERPLYSCFAYEGADEERGFIALRTVDMGGRRFVLVADCQATAPHVVRALYGHAGQWARRQRCIAVIAINTASSAFGLLTSGLAPTPHGMSPRQLVLMGEGIGAAAMSAVETHWDCHVGDWDGL